MKEQKYHVFLNEDDRVLFGTSLVGFVYFGSYDTREKAEHMMRQHTREKEFNYIVIKGVKLEVEEMDAEVQFKIKEDKTNGKKIKQKSRISKTKKNRKNKIRTRLLTLRTNKPGNNSAYQKTATAKEIHYRHKGY